MRLDRLVGVLMLSIGVTAGCGLKFIYSAEPDSAPSLPIKATPPSDLLFESIKNELSVKGNLTVAPSNDSKQSESPLKTSEQPKQLSDISLIQAKTDHRPWKAIESLLKAARELDKQAKQFDLKDEPEVASVFRNKSLMIREMAVEILMITQVSLNNKE